MELECNVSLLIVSLPRLERLFRNNLYLNSNFIIFLIIRLSTKKEWKAIASYKDTDLNKMFIYVGNILMVYI